MTKYYVVAKRFQRESDGSLLVADKRVHTGLDHAEADAVYKRYVRDENGYRNEYWHEVRMTREEDIDEQYQTYLDGLGEGQEF